MKIIAIGRNYAEHAKELNNPVPIVPVIFMKPDTALLKDNKPFYHPDFSEDIHHEIELVLKVSKEGKHIGEKFAAGYYDEIGLGVDFTARDIKKKGYPGNWPRLLMARRLSAALYPNQNLPIFIILISSWISTVKPASRVIPTCCFSASRASSPLYPAISP
jgi:2-keto-4-pentenoate hydratase/2-oxohepta-3-ene-1,7-dioic acid hydratase in catechol pathway